jgi:hypothetical protein
MRPLAICLEDTATGQFVQCVALGGGEPGLSVDPQGEIQWLERPAGCQLAVAEDGRLQVTRTDEQTSARLERGGRTLELALDTPTPVVNRDELVVGRRRLRVHLHGEAPAVSPPTILEQTPPPADLPVDVAVRHRPPKVAGGVIPGTGAAGNLVVLLLVLGGIAALVWWLCR